MAAQVAGIAALPEARLAPDQAAAAARLLMAGNSLPAMPDIAFATARPSSDGSFVAGAIASPPRTDSGHLSLATKASAAAASAASEPEGALTSYRSP